MGKKIEHSSDNESAENNDIFDIFMEENDEQLMFSKKKMILSESGRSLEKFKLKLKAIDLLINILQNNKNVIKKNDVFEYDTFKKLLDMSKANKSYYDPFSKKIKVLSSLFIKNQILLKNEAKYEESIKFVIEVMKNINYDNSFLQQVLDIIKTDEKYYSMFLDKVFEVAFRGRNKFMNKNELRFIIKSSTKHPCYLLQKLLKFSLTKADGGSRTPNQLNKMFNLIFYIFDLNIDNFISENKEENDTNLMLMLEEIKISFKSNLKAQDPDKKNFHIFFNLINLTHKFMILFLNKNYQLENNIKEVLTKLIANFQTLSSSINQLKNMNVKLEELKNKITI
jgi:hypothetical protein